MTDTIRVAHITDTHLGYRALSKQDPVTGRNQRTMDFERAVEAAIDDIIERKVDAVLHAGDVFHQTRPTWQTLRHFIQQFGRLEEAGIPTLVIAGNHDTPRIRTGGSAYSVIELALRKIQFVAEYEDVHVVELFRGLNLHVHAIPHGALTNDDPVIPQTFPGMRNVLMTHGMVPGILEPGRASEPGEQILSTALLRPEFDYIALGHYHLFMQPPGIANGYYAGSTERNGWGDREATPGYCIVEMGEPGERPTVEHIDLPCRPMIELKPVYGNNKTGREIADAVLAQLETLADPTAMTRVAIRQADAPNKREAESILRREAEQFVWHLQVMNERTVQDAISDEVAVTEEFPNIRDLFREFVDQGRGTRYKGTFADEFQAKGDAALEAAMVAANAVNPEEDALS